MPLIDARDIAFGYTGQPHILSGLSFTLNPRERLCITGANGAGKSTLLRVLMGLSKHCEGSLHAFDAPVESDADFRALRRRVGLVFQDPDDQLFCPTVAEDIAFGPLNLGQSQAQALDTVDRVLGQLALSHLTDRITHKLSGGEKRLVALASVLAMEPEVLLLDEPSNALDEENCARLLAILQGLPQAMIIISHDPAVRAALATRSLHLQDGTLI